MSLTLERFSAGEAFAVDPDAIERELAELWREAGRSSASGRPVTRACLWNVVFVVEERDGLEGARGAGALLETIAALPRHLAARALVLRTRHPEAERPELESWISANCVLAGDGGKLVCSEEITLLTRGSGERHLPALVRALLAPSVPVALVVAGVPDHAHPGDRALLELADRLIVHADRSAREAPLAALRAIAQAHPKRGIMDLGWLGLAGLRSQVAALFDPPAGPTELARIAEVTYRGPRAQAQSARLILGWIAQALGARGPLPASEGRHLLERRGRDPMALTLELAGDAPGPAVRFASASGALLGQIACPNARLLEVLPTTGARDVRPLGALQGAPRLARALVSRADDLVFARALEVAATP